MVGNRTGIRGTQHDAEGIVIEVKESERLIFTAYLLSIDCQERENQAPFKNAHSLFFQKNCM